MPADRRLDRDSPSPLRPVGDLGLIGYRAAKESDARLRFESRSQGREALRTLERHSGWDGQPNPEQPQRCRPRSDQPDRSVPAAATIDMASRRWNSSCRFTPQSPLASRPARTPAESAARTSRSRRPSAGNSPASSAGTCEPCPIPSCPQIPIFAYSLCQVTFVRTKCQPRSTLWKSLKARRADSLKSMNPRTGALSYRSDS